MLTTIIVGNRFTYRKREFIYTARGYNSRCAPARRLQQDQSESAIQPVCENAIWIFSGTADGNALASKTIQNGFRVVISTATSYGRDLALERLPGVSVRSGRIGISARYRDLQLSRAVAIVDATHPFATEISSQLIALGTELNIPYLRYEREVIGGSSRAIFCETMEEAAATAIRLGKRIFLATGSKDLKVFLSHPGANEREWFVRVAPEPESLENVLALEVPRSRLIAMQGPCSKELNEVLWKDWQIDCVVTKESGAAGGFSAKAEAAYLLGIPLIVINRPRINYPFVAHDFVSIIDRLRKLQPGFEPSTRENDFCAEPLKPQAKLSL